MYTAFLQCSAKPEIILTANHDINANKTILYCMQSVLAHISSLVLNGAELNYRTAKIGLCWPRTGVTASPRLRLSAN